MIDVLDRQDRRHFIHKKILKFVAPKVLGAVASFVPGGSTAVSLFSSLIKRGGGGAAPPPTRMLPRLKVNRRRAPRVSRPEPRPSSIPPVNPVRRAVITAKPVEALKAAPLPRTRTPQISPVSKPHVIAPIPTPVAVPLVSRAITRIPVRIFASASPAVEPPPQSFRPVTPRPIRSTAMPIHSRIRRLLPQHRPQARPPDAFGPLGPTPGPGSVACSPAIRRVPTMRQ